MVRLHRSSTMINLMLSVVISYMTAVIMLLLVSFLMLKTGIGENTVSVLLVMTYILSTFAGGFYMGRHVEKRRYIWGLAVSGLYIMIYIVMAVTAGDSDAAVADYIKRILLMLAGGALGGMLS